MYVLKFSETPEHHILSGNTFPWKEGIKALEGAKWEPGQKAWKVPKTTDITAFKALVLTAEKEAKDAEKVEKARIASLPKPIPAYGQCCPKGKSDYLTPNDTYSAMCIRCPEHGTRPHMKRGYYVGD